MCLYFGFYVQFKVDLLFLWLWHPMAQVSPDVGLSLPQRQGMQGTCAAGNVVCIVNAAVVAALQL